jgi:PhnB protein
LTVFIEEAHFEHAKSSGVKILEDLHETVYGELQYGAEDWMVTLACSRHARDLSPEQWGATVSRAAVLTPQSSPMLAVSDADAAIEFYKAAFGATVLWYLGGCEHVVVGLSIHGAKMFLETEAPTYGTRGPAAAGFTTVRIELFVDNPEAAQRQALAAGAVFGSPVEQHRHSTTGPYPIKRILQGGRY